MADRNFTMLVEEGRVEAEKQYNDTIAEQRGIAERTYQETVDRERANAEKVFLEQVATMLSEWMAWRTLLSSKKLVILMSLRTHISFRWRWVVPMQRSSSRRRSRRGGRANIY